MFPINVNYTQKKNNTCWETYKQIKKQQILIVVDILGTDIPSCWPQIFICQEPHGADWYAVF